MTWWKRLLWVGCLCLSLLLYVLPMLVQYVVRIYEFPRLWTILLGIFLIFITSMVFIVLAKKSGIFISVWQSFSKRGREENHFRFSRYDSCVFSWNVSFEPNPR